MNGARLLVLIFSVLAQGSAGQPVDPVRGLVAWWPDATAETAVLLRQVGVKTLITEVTIPLAPLARARKEGLAIVAEVPAEAGAVAKAKVMGFDSVAVSASGDAESFGKFLKSQQGYVSIVYMKPEQIGWDVAPALAVLRGGVWPGIASQGSSVASASEGVWLDANSSLIAYLRAVYPKRPAILGYRPDADGGVPATKSVPPRSVEVSLADAFAAGGHVILSVPDDYRQALIKGEARALAAWKTLAGVAAFLQQRREMMRLEPYARVAVIAGDLEQSGEILNLAFRRNLAPVVLPAARVPALSPAEFDVVAAANVPLSAAAIEKLSGFVKAGGTVLAAPGMEEKTHWWTSVGGSKLESADDRDVYSLGKGKIYAYADSVQDPGPFALDLKDAAAEKAPRVNGIKNLDFRIWAAESVLGVLHRVGTTRIGLVLTSYGNTSNRDFLASVRGRYRGAIIYDAASEPPRPLTLMLRAGRVEFSLKQLPRSAIIVLEEQTP